MIRPKTRNGLSKQDARHKLDQVGPNSLPEPTPPSLIFRFFSQFRNALMLLLLGAGFVSFTIGEVLDASFILAIIVVNAGFGVFQEFKAEKALAALKLLTV